MSTSLDMIATLMPAVIAALGVALAAFAIWRADRSARAPAIDTIDETSVEDQTRSDETIAVDPETYQQAARIVLAGRIKTR